MAGLSALQNYVNAATMPGTAPAWWGEANFARLGEGTIFRFSWWTWAWVKVPAVLVAWVAEPPLVGCEPLPVNWL